jgi:hypothetical protein
MLMLAVMPAGVSASQDEMHLTHYEVSFDVDVEENVISGTQHIIYYNREDAALESLYLTLYPNAFDDEATAPLIAPASVSYPSGFDPGSIEVEVRGRTYEVVDDTFLRIDLEEPLDIGDSIEFTLDVEIDVPHLTHRFGHHDGIIYVGNAIPLVCPFEGGRWVRHPYTARGDPFYSETAHWDVTITVPKGWTVAATGSLVEETDDISMNTVRFTAHDTRDFAFSCSERYLVTSVEHGSTTIHSYYLPGHEEGGVRACEVAREAIGVFEQRFGPYPYDTFSIAETHLGAAGMEYPHLIFVDSGYYGSPNDMIFDVIIAHEVAHQWWYGVVGNDQVRHSFIDESLAQFSTLTFFESRGEEVATTYYENYLRRSYDRARTEGLSDVIDRSLEGYGSDYEYMVMVYWKGPLVLDMLRWLVGDEGFYDTLSDIYEAYAFDIIDIAAFEDEFVDRFPDKGLDSFFDVLMRSDALPDVVADEAHRGDDGATIDPRVDVLDMPVEAQVTMADGSTSMVSGYPPLAIDTDSDPRSYLLDPRDRIVESNEGNNAGEFSEEEGGISLPYVPIGLIAAIVIALIWRRRS